MNRGSTLRQAITEMLRHLLHYFEKTSTGDKRVADQTEIYEAGLRDMQTSVREASTEARDVTQRFQGDRLLSDAIVLCDIDGLISKSNSEAGDMFGFDVNHHTIDELLRFAEPWHSVFTKEPMIPVIMTLDATPHTGVVFAAEVTLVRLVDTPPIKPRVLLLMRHIEARKEQFRDVAVRVQEALDRLNERLDGG